MQNLRILKNNKTQRETQLNGRKNRNSYRLFITMLLLHLGAERNFRKQVDWDPLGSPYDLGSVMHYGGYFFSSRGQPTILDK